MKVTLGIDLNREEKELLSKQIRIEFANSNRQVTQLLDYKEKENKRRYQTGFPGPKFDLEYYTKISNRLNKHMQDCCRLAIISNAFKCEEGIYQVDGQYYGVKLFYETHRNLINGMKYMDMGRLVIHLMRRAGIINKETRNQLLSVKKERGQVVKEKAIRKRVEDIQKRFKECVEEMTQLMNGDEKIKFLYAIDLNKALAETFGEKYVTPMAFVIQ